jgi:hypothetical protein
MGFVLSKEESWASEDFGRARLGDERRTARLVRIGSLLARASTGTIAGCFPDGADREAAYRFVENEAISVDAIVEAAVQAAFRRACQGQYSFVFAPIDGSTISIATAMEEGGFGPVGDSTSVTLGLESMNCILVSPGGVVIGVGGQKYWARAKAKKQKKARAGQRPVEETENAYWLLVMEQALAAQRAEGPDAPKLWFQLDRGGDARDILFWASYQDCWVTVRAAQDRRVTAPEEGHLWSTLESQAAAGRYELKVPATATRKARTAIIEVRFTSVLLPLRNTWSNSETPTPMYAVLAKEISDACGDEPIEWMLLTNREVHDFESARLVVEGYSKRWKVEEVHRTWKTTCKVEKAALQEASHFERWAAILFASAVRIERLKTMARGAEGSRPATDEFDDVEIEALLVLRARTQNSTGLLTITQAVRWLADLGGYAGPSSSGPPGAVTLARGLQTLAPAAELLRNLRRQPPKM